VPLRGSFPATSILAYASEEARRRGRDLRAFVCDDAEEENEEEETRVDQGRDDDDDGDDDDDDDGG